MLFLLKIPVALFALSLLADAACAKETIVWGRFNTAPNMIIEGPDKDKGTFDLVRAVLEKQLDTYEHKQAVAPFPRIFHEIKNGGSWCFVGGSKSVEREQFALFSVPAVITLPHKVIVRKADLKRFGKGPVSLEKLLSTPGLRTSTLRERSINPVVDSLLRRYPPGERHSEFSESIQMLLAGRLDFLVETTVIVDYFARQNGHAGELVELDIREYGEPSYFHVMCPKNAWGMRVIESVNKVLQAERGNAAYRSIMEKWSNPQEALQMRRAYQHGFVTSH
jgi:polar amino acid transport system substrate-binding protein